MASLHDEVTRHGRGTWHLVDDLSAAADRLRRLGGPWAVVADDTTADLAGRRLAGDLGAELLLVAARHEALVVAGDAEAERLERDLRDAGAGRALAVGSGTINDLTKIAAHRAGLPAAVVPTAPSMNGYTSAGVALLEGGVKTTLPCAPPEHVVCAVDLLATAPARMRAAGFADLRSRPVSVTDWYLSHRLLDTAWDAAALRLVADADALAGASLEGLADGAPLAVAQLTVALLISGRAMDMAGTSAPSSGGEHLVSHWLDMVHHARGGPQDLHGCQVGVATRATARLYERLLRAGPADLTPAPIPAWETVAEHLRERLGSAWPAVEPVARDVHGDGLGHRARVDRLRAQWAEISVQLRELLGEAPDSAADLQRAGAPVRFADLGIDAAAARDALRCARYVRRRYTILDLAADLGWLDDALDEALDL